ncbi:HAMP domain-containing histidine kinase [Candidatus Peregrinibacteria bacterium]|nr:HAMP domain-containing histidine kinase [Candidatus Peregrinibacteria bacterium]
MINCSYHVRKRKVPSFHSTTKEVEFLSQENDHSNSIKKYNLINNLHHTPTLVTLLKNMMRIKEISGFHTLQVVVHAKGSQIIHNNLLEKDKVHSSKEEHFQWTLPYFDKVFSQIKKSKSKVFNNFSPDEVAISAIGPFLGKAFELKSHRVIFILSRNDFLGPSESDRDLFQSLTFYIKHLFDDILKIESLKERSLMYKAAFQEFPLPIKIRDKNKIVLKNNNFNQSLAEQSSKDAPYGITIPLEGPNNFSLYLDNDTFINAHYHHTRIGLLGQLLNTLQHELSNPLFGIILSVEILKLDESLKEIHSSISDISLYSEKCQKIIQSFGYLFKESEKTCINVNNLINEVVLMAKSESRGIEKKIEFVNTDKPGDFSFPLNPTWTGQILFNLILNSSHAIQSAKLSTPCIIISIDRPTPEVLKIKVKDNGPGISKSVIQKIFDPFYTTKEKGSGLGLSTSLYLAQKMGGMLQFKEEENITGACFELTLTQELKC